MIESCLGGFIVLPSSIINAISAGFSDTYLCHSQVGIFMALGEVLVLVYLRIVYYACKCKCNVNVGGNIIWLINTNMLGSTRFGQNQSGSLAMPEAGSSNNPAQLDRKKNRGRDRERWAKQTKQYQNIQPANKQANHKLKTINSNSLANMHATLFRIR